MGDAPVGIVTDLEDPANHTLGPGGNTGGGAVASPPGGGGGVAYGIENGRVVGIPTMFHFWSPIPWARDHSVAAERRLDEFVNADLPAPASVVHNKIATDTWGSNSDGILPLIFKNRGTYVHFGWLAINTADVADRHAAAIKFAQRFQMKNDKS